MQVAAGLSSMRSVLAKFFIYTSPTFSYRLNRELSLSTLVLKILDSLYDLRTPRNRHVKSAFPPPFASLIETPIFWICLLPSTVADTSVSLVPNNSTKQLDGVETGQRR